MKRIALAFSGGLDTSWCVPWLMEEHGAEVVTVTVDVGGLEPSEVAGLEARSRELGAASHIHVDAREVFFDEVVRYLIAGNVLRGDVYPICVGAERTLQAREVARVAKELGADAIAHGCTAAGNDQVRFEVALRTLAPGCPILAPIRDEAPRREDEVAFLEQRGFEVPARTGSYSINSGLWGVTIGGVETAGSERSIPEEAWVRTRGAFAEGRGPARHTIGFRAGVPTAVDGRELGPVNVVEAVDFIGASYGIGRGIHLGDTILGIKGRVAFEAPAAALLLPAHRELEKLTLTSAQLRLKDGLGRVYGDLVHEGSILDPAARDIEAFLRSSQARVTGEVTLSLQPGRLFVEGVTSPYSLLAASRAVYGEEAGEWSPADAAGFAKLRALPSLLHARAGEGGVVRSIVLDKIASVTLNCGLSKEARLGDTFPCEEGDVVAVKVLTRKSTYNELELTTGRYSQLKPGDVIAGALGHRRALNVYAGHLPEELVVGQEIDLLNLGGVLGVCDSAHPDLGAPFRCEVLGQVLHFPYLGERIGVPANIRQGTQPFVDAIDVHGVPVVAVVGTCMNSGKTAACNVLVQEFARGRMRVHGAKATGVSLRRDVLSMEDSGAAETLSFTDLGVVTTTPRNAPQITQTLLTRLSEARPDVIVLELGDGLLGEYGVDAILSDPAIRSSFSAVILAANDPVGVWGGVRRLREEYDIETTVVTGPATDNAAGTDVVRDRMGVPAVNARSEPVALAELVASTWMEGKA